MRAARCIWSREEVDSGRVLAQERVNILARDDTAESLAARVLEAEHRLYPLALEAYAEAHRRGGSTCSRLLRSAAS